MKLEDSFGSATHVGSSIKISPITKFFYVKSVGTILFLKLLTVWMQKEIWFYIGRRDGSLIIKFLNGNKKSMKNKKEIKNIKDQDVVNVLLYFIIEPSIFETAWWEWYLSIYQFINLNNIS